MGEKVRLVQGGEGYLIVERVQFKLIIFFPFHMNSSDEVDVDRIINKLL